MTGVSVDPSNDCKGNDHEKSSQHNQENAQSSVHQRAVALVKTGHRHEESDGDHAVKVDLVNHLLCHHLPFPVQIERKCMATKVQQHEGHGDQEVFLEPAGVSRYRQLVHHRVPKRSEGYQRQHRCGHAGHRHLHTQSEGQKSHGAEDKRGPDVSLEDAVPLPDAHNAAHDDLLTYTLTGEVAPVETDIGSCSFAGALAHPRLVLLVEVHLAEPFFRAHQFQVEDVISRLLNADLESHFFVVEGIAAVVKV
mmetsp:Transcript_62007/g.145436  ORF Transcript_62007/g.145436 Transcript_62007/m.145436 type:complete len:251 (-) Transcript_62007:534-1286(-)